ncbi:MAG: hypothetical protein ACRD6X_02315 [Pyrinomonadaceae bacterium]
MAGTNSNSEKKIKGLTFGRETRVRKPVVKNGSDNPVFAVCIKTDDDDLLFPKKVYKIWMRGGTRVLVIDEEGEPAIYPKDHFLVLSLSSKAENTLAGVLE